jgi:pSer/pThr/pTyr-binding forkhead associated (FHA) protein
MDKLLLSALADELTRAGEEAFLEKYPHPFLLIVSHPPIAQDFLEPKTMLGKVQSIEATMQEKNRGPAVVALRKSDRNAFQAKITVGRARNNDIVLRASKVSKLHAVFTADGKGQYQLTDMGSSNGTEIQGQRLEKNKAVRIEDGSTLSIWKFEFRFFGPEAFVRHLQGGGS